jgi:DNA-binding transcriptional ArsR family regulator
MTYFVREDDKGHRVFKTSVMHPKNLGVLGTDISMRIVEELSKTPQCAMDVARKLKQHEQKIYYHIRKLEKAGILKIVGREERVGALAKIYSVAYPYLTVKLFEGQHLGNVSVKPSQVEFFTSFVKDGKLDATIVIGSPDPHGKYGVQASDGSAAIDLALLLGTFVRDVQPNYKLDTELRDDDMKRNLILIGGPKANIMIDKLNAKLPIYFDAKNDFDIFSTLTKSRYSGDEIGVIVKIKNPHDKSKEILVLSGKRFKGTKAAIIALLKHMKKIKSDEGFVAKVVRGIDRDSDGKIDDVEFLE